MSYLKLGAAAAILIALLSLGGTAAWYRGNAIAAQAARDRALADLSTAVAANRAQEETIGRLRATAAADDKLLAEMADELAAINSRITETSEAVVDLKDANEDVRAYLGSAVPPDLRMLLDR